jgi:MFS family permease
MGVRFMSTLSNSQRWCLLFGVSLLSFTGFLDATIVSTALPNIQESLRLSVSQLQWVMNAFFLGISACMASMGRLGDLYGRRNIFYSGTLIFVLASLGAAFSVNAVMLIICRAFQGITTAITIPVGIAIIQNAHEKKDLAKAMGVFGSITGAGLALGPVIGGALVAVFSWPAVFFINIPFVIIGFSLCAISVQESKSDVKMSLDYWGMLFLTLTIASLVFAMVEVNTLGWRAQSVGISLVITLLSFIILVFVERHVKHPIMAGYLFRSRIFLASALFAFVGGGAMSVVLFMDPVYLQIVLDKSDFVTGVFLFVIPVCVVLMASLVGAVHHRVGSKRLMVLASVAYLLMSLFHMMFGISLSYAILMPAFVLMGLAWGVVNTVPGTALGENIHGDHIGVAIGALFSFYNIGAAVLLALSVVIFHIKASASLSVQFLQQHLKVSSSDQVALKQFISQPDQLHQIATRLDVNYGVAVNLLKQAFAAGLHGAFAMVALVSLLALLGVALIMKVPAAFVSK